MEFKYPAMWPNGLNNSQLTGTVRSLYDYAEAWADLMEAEMEKGTALTACAQITSFQANTEDLSLPIRKQAMHTLVKVWKHGDALRTWYARYGSY